MSHTPGLRNPFKLADKRKQFEGMVRDFNERNSALFHKDGRENQSNNIGNAFWRGYHGQMAAWVQINTPLYIAYAAGKFIGRAHGTPAK